MAIGMKALGRLVGEAFMQDPPRSMRNPSTAQITFHCKVKQLNAGASCARMGRPTSWIYFRPGDRSGRTSWGLVGVNVSAAARTAIRRTQREQRRLPSNGASFAAERDQGVDFR